MKTYAAYYDNEIRIESSSGGLFSIFAKQFEIVYGVAMTEDCYGAEYRRIDDGKIDLLRGSKYLQAKVGDTYKQVKEDLTCGKKVLFVGTGCQINGLKNFLLKNYENLTTIDIICHGIPSPQVWREYVCFQERKYGKLKSVNFRCKNNSWQNFGIKENKIYIPKEDDVFMQMFLSDYCLRPSCYQCMAKFIKQSDITIGDFWGVDAVIPKMNDKKGTSIVIIRTENGQILFNKFKEDLICAEVTYEDAVKWNPAEYKSVNRPNERDRFFLDMHELPFDILSKKYVNNPLWKKVARRTKQTLEHIFGIGIASKYGVLYMFEK